MECLRTILDCARVDLADLDLEDAPMLRIALSLARAEARLASVRDAEETFLKDYAEGADLSPYLKKVRTITVQKTVVSRKGQSSYEETETVIEKWTPVERRLALLGRYRAEAESRRSKALQRWLEVAEWDAEMAISRNEANLQGCPDPDRTLRERPD